MTQKNVGVDRCGDYFDLCFVPIPTRSVPFSLHILPYYTIVSLYLDDVIALITIPLTC
jgi:hypothetical protein